MAVGDRVISIASDHDIVFIHPKHILHTSYQKDLIYDNRKERLKEFGKLHRILSQNEISVTFTSLETGNTTTVKLTLDQNRPLSTISINVWLAFLISISASLMGVLLWAWQPKQIETILLFLSGIAFSSLPYKVQRIF